MGSFRKMHAAISLAAILVLAACSGGGNGGVATSNPSPASSATPEREGSQGQPVTLTVQYPKADNPISIENTDKGIAKFVDANPHVTIKKNDWQYSPNEIGIKMAARQAPSFFSTFATEGKTLVEHGWAADLTAYMAEYERADEFNQTLSGVFTFNEKLYGIPLNAYITGIIINKRLFEEKNVPLPSLDWTWDDLYEAAEAIADPAKGVAGFAIMAKGNEGGWNWTNLLYQAGGVAQESVDGKVVSAFHSEAGVKAMEYLKKLRWEAGAMPQNWALNYGDTYNLFKQGRAAIVFGNNGNIEDAVNNGGMNMEDLLLMPMPAMEKGGEQVGVMGGNYMIVNPQESVDVQRTAFRYVTWNLFSDEYIEENRSDLEARKANGQIRVPNVAEYWNPGSAFDAKVQALYDEYPDTVYRIDPKVVDLTQGKPEPTYAAQDFYAAITNVMQEVFTNENADVRVLLEQSAADFDRDFLSKITP